MKKIISLAILLIFSITACDGWSYSVPTFPVPPPSITPAIYSPTPVIVTITNTPVLPTATPTKTATQTPATETATNTATAFTKAPSPLPSPTLPPLSPQIIVDILGCNTSLDITHGMGEVTNAYVTLKNNTGIDMTGLCATLFALDEGRIHPDKTACVPVLQHGLQVTLKLTADSTYQQETPIQIEAKSGETLLSRVASPSCTDIGMFAPDPGLLLTPIAIQ